MNWRGESIVLFFATHLLASFIVLAIAEVIDSGYLVWQHYHKKPLVCPLDHKCDVVTESKWSHIFIVRNEVLGLLFYISLAIGILLFMFLPELQVVLFLLLLATMGGVLFSLLLTFIQIFMIKDYCFYCLISALLSLLLFLNMVGIYSSWFCTKNCF